MKYPFQDKFLYTEQNKSVGVEGQWNTVMSLNFGQVDADQTVPLLFTYGIKRFFHDVAHFILTQSSRVGQN